MLELLASIAILSIVTMLALPSMERWIAHYRLVGATNEMAVALRAAQSQAVIRKREVWFCGKHPRKDACGYSPRATHQWLVSVPALKQNHTSSAQSTEEEMLRQIDISSSLEVKDCLLNDNKFKIAPNGRFYTTEDRYTSVRICAPSLAGNNGTREIWVDAGLVRVTSSDASCDKYALC